MKYAQQAILFQTDRAREAISSAQGAITAGRYQVADSHLQPLSAKNLPTHLAARLLEARAACALAGVGRDWPGLLRQARVAYQLVGDSAGVGRVQECAGAAHLARGEFAVAHKALEQAAEAYGAVEDRRGQASVCLHQVRLALRRGQLPLALRLSQRVVQLYAILVDGAGEALARLLRAQVLAAMQRTSEAAPDLLWAERLVGPETSPLMRVRLGLARAKVLVDLGHNRRAAAGLLRLEHAVHTLSVIPCSADFARCLGLALRHDNAEAAVRHLTRARLLHEQLGQTYHVVECELGLASAEGRLGRPLGARLDALRGYNLEGWPILWTEYQTVLQQRAWARAPKASQPAAVVQAPVAEPGLVQRLQAAFRWVWRGPEAATGDVAPQEETGVATAWGPLTTTGEKKPRTRKRQQQEEDQGVNYTPSIRSTSLDMRV